jgi:hypothetical protein
MAKFTYDALGKFCTENSETLRGAKRTDVLSALALAACELPPGVVRELVQIYREEAKKHGAS